MKPSKIKFGSGFGGGIPTNSKGKRPIVYPGKVPNVEADTIVELTELQKDFKAAAKKETELHEANTNSEFYSVLVFKTQAQRDAFYKLLGIDSKDLTYISGQKLIKALQLKIDEVEIKNPGKFKCNVEILNLAMQL